MDRNQAQFIKTCQLLTARLVHILVQARTGQECSARCTSTYNQDDYFGLHVEELSEVTEFLDKNIQNYPPSTQNITVDFLMCIDNCYLPMESWCVAVSDARSANTADQNKAAMSFFDWNKLSNDVSTLLKASIAAARATPMFRYFVKKPECERHVIFYRVSEGPPEIELGGGQKQCNIGKVSTPLGTISLDVFYRVEFETCKDSCCGRDGSKDGNSKASETLERKNDSDMKTYLPFSPNGELVSTSTGSESSCFSNKQEVLTRKSKTTLPRRKISFYLEKPSSSSDSSTSSLTDIVPVEDPNFLVSKKLRNSDSANPVPFLALLTASYTENRPPHETAPLEEDVPDGSTMYESVASTLVFSSSENQIAPDSKVSYYSFLDSDDDSTNSEVDDVSENSFIKGRRDAAQFKLATEECLSYYGKEFYDIVRLILPQVVPFALLPTGDPSNVGDFIMFLRRCEVQEFAFTLEKMDLLLQQLPQFETWQHSFDNFLAEITENVEA